jgi:hypothetical protein
LLPAKGRKQHSARPKKQLGPASHYSVKIHRIHCAGVLAPALQATAQAVFSSFKIPKILQDFPSHQIFRRMHEALNIGKKITNYTVWL